MINLVLFNSPENFVFILLVQINYIPQYKGAQEREFQQLCIVTQIESCLKENFGYIANNEIVLQVGTYQIAVMAKSLSKPFYVVAESFKFVRLFPLKQTDIRNTEKVWSKLKIVR